MQQNLPNHTDGYKVFIVWFP